MRTLSFVTAAIFFTLMSCNTGSDNSTGTDTASAAVATDTMHHDMPMPAEPAAMQPAPAGAKVFFKNLKDGQSVSNPVKIEMGIEGMAIDTAGSMAAGTGHHHLLIDLDSIPEGTVVPKDSTHLHFGKGQAETTVTLTPGKHKLTLQLGDGLHRSYGARLTSSVTVDVKK
ncbi:MAG TPA: DUF4399 domain-containing protein [Panacibacter sp.]|nr:DUF4399 domain-containing protein [Panacibacter sp.]HNP43749.1 DUF4399 domain-containing protein [Panacibacter sp.]